MTDEQYETIVLLLSEIRDVLVAGIQASDEEGDECTHPEPMRADFSTPNDPDHWQCAVCKYEHKGLTRN